MSNRYDHIKFRHSVDSSKGFPEGPHLAIIEFGSIHIEGDERSRTNPGHGYSAYTQGTTSYYWFAPEDREHWLFFISDLMGVGQYSTRKDFIALDNGVMVKPQLNVSVSL